MFEMEFYYFIIEKYGMVNILGISQSNAKGE